MSSFWGNHQRTWAMNSPVKVNVVSDFVLELPEGFEDCEWEVAAKGWLSGVRLIVSGVTYRLNFYDPVRLGQEMTDELRGQVLFFEPNLIVLQTVKRSAMERAVELLINSGRFNSLTPE